MTDSNIGRFVWYDLMTPDPDAAIRFYSHVVGWKTQPFEKGYTMFVGEQGPLGGVVELTDALKKMGAPPHWTSNVQVADVDATAKQAVALGGRVYKEPSDFATVGRLAVIADAQGAPMNIFAPLKPMTLHDSTRAGEFTWSELATSDHASALKFYGALFGWKQLREFDMGPMGKYVIYGTTGEGGKELGGIFTGPKDMPVPPLWTYYTQVADLDAAIERAKSKEARLVHGPVEVPGGARIARLVDPQRVPFALHEAAKRPG